MEKIICLGIIGEKIEKQAEKHNGTSSTWTLGGVVNPVPLPLQGHNKKSTERTTGDEKKMKKKITEQLLERGLE